MVAPLLLLPAAVFFSFLYDLWVIVLALAVCMYFVLKRRPPEDAFYFVPVIIAAAVVSLLTRAQFDSFMFVLQLVLYAVFFVIGSEIEASGKKQYFLLALSGFLFLPFFYTGSGHHNPNIISAYIALEVLLVWMSGLQKPLKYALSLLGLYFIIINGSYTALLSLLTGWALVKKNRKYLLPAALIAASVIFFNRHSFLERIVWFKDAAEIFFLKPLGAGFFSSKYYLAGRHWQNTLFLHSFAAQFAAEGGVLCIAAVLPGLLYFLPKLKQSNYQYAVFSVALLGVFDLSYYMTSQGLIAALILGVALPDKTTRRLSPAKLALWRASFVSAFFMGVVMFLTSRNLAMGNYYLVTGRKSKAISQYGKAFGFPRYPALLSAEATAWSLSYDESGNPSDRQKSFSLQKKALVDRDPSSPAYYDYQRALVSGKTETLRKSCAGILFVNGIK